MTRNSANTRVTPPPPARIHDSTFKLIPSLIIRRSSFLLTLLFCHLCVIFVRADAIDTARLLDDLTDLPRLARLPDPAYVTRQFSSYDRSAKSPTQDWFANCDYDQFIRTEQRDGRTEHVMMDAAGPGAIVRIWSANPKGVLRIYLDEGTQPVIEQKMQDLLGGAVEDFPAPLSGKRSGGYNFYFPIPYAGRCVVTTDEGGSFYHINYRTYAPGTPVRTFSPGDCTRLREKIRLAAETLANPRERAALPADRSTTEFDATLDSARPRILWEQHNGPGAICEFRVRLTAANIENAARAIVLTITFDDRQTVECPLGDFFATAPGLNAFDSLPAGVTSDNPPVMYCRWIMPFSTSAVIEARNLGDEPVHLAGTLCTSTWTWDDRSLHFHADWRTRKQIPARPTFDWTHLACTGHGRFVGGMLHLQNSRRTWWGEGDEKIYVDGESFPSHFGTGTEDYYGYAYCSTLPFTHAYHNQVRCDGPGNFGNTCVSRFHVMDDIPFTTRFQFDMENWMDADGDAYTNRAAVSYWYARPGGKSAGPRITPADVALESFKWFKVDAAQEGESLRTVHKSAGRAVKEQTNGNGEWSDGAYLLWSEARPGEKLTLEFDSPKAATQIVVASFTKGPTFGIFRLSVDGRRAAGPIDLYAPTTTTTGPVELGSFPLAAGPNQLSVVIVGSNRAATKSCHFGLDYLLLK